MLITYTTFTPYLDELASFLSDYFFRSSFQTQSDLWPLTIFALIAYVLYSYAFRGGIRIISNPNLFNAYLNKSYVKLQSEVPDKAGLLTFDKFINAEIIVGIIALVLIFLESRKFYIDAFSGFNTLHFWNALLGLAISIWVVYRNLSKPINPTKFNNGM